jgi:hypothetical protein
LHKKDRALLELIRASLGGVGNITNLGKDSIQYRVSSVKDLRVIIDHFEKYLLLTQKLADYILFKQAFEIVKRKEHLTPEGLHKIVAIKASINNGLTETLKSAFPGVIPVPRPVVVDKEIKDPHWLAGFVSGEGCFFINIFKSSSYKSGFSVRLRFILTQHTRDEELLKSLVSYLDCGKYLLSEGHD